ncbi:hypothetical protein EL466_13865 [Enterococcus faecium]|nr:hypothetical protein [Enterococcus faecium]PQE57385.1 hypothetical protein CUS10_14445 [Enterococcus faecium]
MLFIVCILAVWLKLLDYIDISWWLLGVSVFITLILGMIEILLIFKEIKYSVKERKLNKRK